MASDIRVQLAIAQDPNAARYLDPSGWRPSGASDHSTALNEAVRRSHLEQNPAELAKTPPIIEHEVEPYSVLEVQKLIEAAKHERNELDGLSRLSSAYGRGRPSVSNGMTSTG